MASDYAYQHLVYDKVTSSLGGGLRVPPSEDSSRLTFVWPMASCLRRAVVTATQCRTDLLHSSPAIWQFGVSA